MLCDMHVHECVGMVSVGRCVDPSKLDSHQETKIKACDFTQHGMSS